MEDKQPKKEEKKKSKRGRLGEGRPTGYSSKIIDDTKWYLKNYETVGDVMPSIAGLAFYLKIGRSTIYEWAKDKEKRQFADILGDILSDQERTLLNKGLKGEFNPTIAKLALGKHGYTERQDVTSGNKPIPILGIHVPNNDSDEENQGA